MAEALLMKEMDMTSQDVQRRLRVVDFGPEDSKRVQTLTKVIGEHVDELTSGFFDYLGSLDEAAGVIKDPKTLAAARRMKTAHLKAMTKGQYGEDYVEERLKLGMLYAKAGLDPRVFLGAFHHLMRTIGFKVMERFKGKPQEGFENFMSLKKVAFFDLGLIIDVILFERERLIGQQQDAIRELSTPVMQLRERLLMLPIIGLIDTRRAKQLTEDLLRAIRAHRAKVVVMDITGVPIVDSKVANHLVQTVLAARLMGAFTVVTGLSAQVAQALVALGVDVGKLNTVGDLQGGIEEAERILGYKVTRDDSPHDVASGAPIDGIR
jgi:rsbT co-antagonist protein RsbR